MLTTSTSIQLIFGDVLAIALMRLKQFSLDEYSMNHPAAIWQKNYSEVKDLMLTGDKFRSASSPGVKLIDVLRELSNKRCGCVLIVYSDSKLQGIFTDGDLRRALQTKGSASLETKISDLMTRTPRTVEPNILAWDAMKVMESKHKAEITVLPVIDSDSKVVGVIRLHDIVQTGI